MCRWVATCTSRPECLNMVNHRIRSWFLPHTWDIFRYPWFYLTASGHFVSLSWGVGCFQFVESHFVVPWLCSLQASLRIPSCYLVWKITFWVFLRAQFWPVLLSVVLGKSRKKCRSFSMSIRSMGWSALAWFLSHMCTCIWGVLVIYLTSRRWNVVSANNERGAIERAKTVFWVKKSYESGHQILFRPIEHEQTWQDCVSFRMISWKWCPCQITPTFKDSTIFKFQVSFGRYHCTIVFCSWHLAHFFVLSCESMQLFLFRNLSTHLSFRSG